jgi:Uma2 family endonuclease
MDALPPSGHSTFLPLCPDVVIEFKLPAGLPKISHAKMQEYMENGAQLGWLIDTLTATEPLTNLTLHMAEVWNPLQ